MPFSDTTETTDIRRLGYYISKSDGSLDFLVHAKVANAGVLAEFREISNAISTLQPIIFAFDVVERNHRELMDSVEGNQTRMNDLGMENAVPMSAGMDGMVLVIQKVSNFLSSASAFLTQTETQLRRVHGKKSLELDIWNEERKNLHATSFSYRFLYELRNFTQHWSLPLSSFNIAGERASENAPMVFKTRAILLRDGILGVGYDWKKSVEAEIQLQPPEFELLPLIAEYLHSLRHLCLLAIQRHSVRLAECARYLYVVRRTLKAPVYAVPVFFIGESPTEGQPPSRLEVFPIAQFEYLLREYDRLINACDTTVDEGKPRRS